MYDQSLYQKVCNMTCSEQELTTLSSQLSVTDFDLDHPFEKYYSLSTIEKVINQYLDGKITDHYLAHWMNTYNWMISAAAQDETNDAKYTLQEYIQYEISDTLDALSFFDETDFENIDADTPKSYQSPKAYLIDCLERFKYYDSIYQNLNNFEIYYQIISEKGQDDILEFLCLNHSNKTYLFLDIDIYSKGDQIAATRLTATELDTKVQDLKKSGYQLIEPNFEEFN